MPRETSKQDIRRNPLADWVIAGVRYISGHRTLIIALIAAAAVIAGAMGVFFWYEGRQEAEAQKALAGAEKALGIDKPGATPNTDEASKRLSEVAAQYPRTVAAQEALIRLGNFRFDDKKYDDAIAAFSQYLSQFPRGKFRAMAAIGKAYAEEAKGDLEGANKTLNAIVASAPNDPLAGEAYSTLARTYESLKKPEDALRVYGQIAEKFPQTQWAQNALQRMSVLKAKS
jgi:tetratricopeptide (TPR) repeat protein